MCEAAPTRAPVYASRSPGIPPTSRSVALLNSFITSSSLIPGTSRAGFVNWLAFLAYKSVPNFSC